MGILIYCPRSGSTKLAHELGPKGISVIPEFRSFEWLLSRSDTVVSKEALQQVWDKDPQIGNLGVVPPLLESGGSSTGAAVLRAIANAYGLESGASVVLFKFGWGVAYRPQLISAFGPDFPAIALLRDGRAVLNSMQKSRRPYPPHTSMARDDSWFAAVQWRKHITQLERDWINTHNRLAVLRFEDLVDRPTATIDELLESTALRPSSTTGSAFAFAPTEEAIHQLVEKPLDPTRSEAWMSELSQDDISLAEHLCGAELERYGYLPVGNPVSSLRLTLSRVNHFWKQIRFSALSAQVALRGDATAPLLARARTRFARIGGLGG